MRQQCFLYVCLTTCCGVLAVMQVAESADGQQPTQFSASEKVKLLMDNEAGSKIAKLSRAAPAHTIVEAEAIAGLDRAQIVAILHELLRDDRVRYQSGYYYPDIFQVLLQLGDERGMQLLAEQLRTDPVFTQNDMSGAEIDEALQRAAQPAVIPYLAPLLFINETPESGIHLPPGGDIPTGDKVSFQTLYMIEHVLERAEMIPMAVKQWVRRSRSPSPERGEHREILREWWRANQEAFQRKDYAAVRPGREWQPTASENSTLQSPATHVPTLPDTDPSRVNRGAAKIPSAAAAGSPTPSLAQLITASAVALALLAGVLVFAKTRR